MAKELVLSNPRREINDENCNETSFCVPTTKAASSGRATWETWKMALTIALPICAVCIAVMIVYNVHMTRRRPAGRHFPDDSLEAPDRPILGGVTIRDMLEMTTSGSGSGEFLDCFNVAVFISWEKIIDRRIGFRVTVPVKGHAPANDNLKKKGPIKYFSLTTKKYLSRFNKLKITFFRTP